MSAATDASGAAPADMRRLGWAAFWLGFGLGGFFDGIILHQILQWHHLLSNVFPEVTVPDLRFQVLADGLFHVATYAFTVLGLWLLWTARGALPRPGARQRVIAMGLIGFGVWHIADAILFHWTLRIHRIRMDADNLLLWDILWLVPFGIVPAVIGHWLLRRRPKEGPPGGGRTAAVALALAALVTGAIAPLPPAGLPDDRTLAVFRPGMDFPAIVAAAGGRGRPARLVGRGRRRLADRARTGRPPGRALPPRRDPRLERAGRARLPELERDLNQATQIRPPDPIAERYSPEAPRGSRRAPEEAASSCASAATSIVAGLGFA
jgi:uncharacterized membrane protein